MALKLFYERMIDFLENNIICVPFVLLREPLRMDVKVRMLNWADLLLHLNLRSCVL